MPVFFSAGRMCALRLQRCALEGGGWRGSLPQRRPPLFNLRRLQCSSSASMIMTKESSLEATILIFWGLFRILKFNVATVMQKPDYILIVEIFGREYILS
jgi:hypothetical protein